MPTTTLKARLAPSSTRSAWVILGVVILVEICRVPLLGLPLLVIGLLVQKDRRRAYPAVALLGFAVVLSAAKVVTSPERWPTLAKLSLSLAAIAGAFLLGSKLRLALASARLNVIGLTLLGSGLVASVVAASRGFIFNRFLTIGALLLVVGSRRARLDASRVALVLAIAGIQFFQGSRASALLVILVTGLFGLMQGWSGGRPQRAAASVVACAATGAVLVAAFTLEPIRLRVFNDGRIVEGIYLADRNRLSIAAVRTVFEHAWSPFIGARVGSYRYVDKLNLAYPYPHDIVMQLILDFGLVIGVVALAGVLRAYRRCLRLSINGQPADRAATAVALALGLLMLFNGTYMDYRFGALWLGAALAGVGTAGVVAETRE